MKSRKRSGTSGVTRRNAIFETVNVTYDRFHGQGPTMGSCQCFAFLTLAYAALKVACLRFGGVASRRITLAVGPPRNEQTAAETSGEAREHAVDAVVARGHCGLPDTPVVGDEVVRDDVRDAELEQPTLRDLGLRLGGSQDPGGQQTPVHQFAATQPDFTGPL